MIMIIRWWVLQIRISYAATGGVIKKGVLKNFAKFTGKHWCQSLFFNKDADLNPATSSKTDSGTGVFL